MEENSVIIFQKAALMLIQADTIQKAKELKDLALTAADWAQRKGMGEEAIRYAKSYALEAERKMGQMLKETERAKGTRLGGNVVLPPDDTPTLADLGLTKRDSVEAQTLAELSDDNFEAIKSGEKTRTEIKRELKKEKIKKFIPSELMGKYRIFYADPPWKYGDQLTENYGPTRFHYPAMTITDLCALPIKDLAEENAVLFLWVTSPLLEECWDVIKSWGFKYKTSFIWDKIKHNFGHYNSVRHELLLVCTRGSCTPDVPKLFDSVLSVERTEHSKKPDEFRNIIETIYTHGNKIELFAREQNEGWVVWGNEI